MCSQWLVVLVKKRMTPSGACLAFNRDEDKKAKDFYIHNSEYFCRYGVLPQMLIVREAPISEVQTRWDVKIFFLCLASAPFTCYYI